MKALHADQLWTDYSPLKLAGLPVGRRLSVARNAHGKLVVFSPLRGSPKNVTALRQLGDVAAFVVPSRFHDLFFPDYFAAFPTARFLGNRGVIAEHPDWPLHEITADLPELAGFDSLLLAGMPKMDEQIFLHRASRTLIVADALFNVPQPAGLLARLVGSLADIGGGAPRQSRFGRINVKDRAAFAAALRAIATWDFDRIVPGHGEVVESDGRRVWREAFRALAD